MDEYYEQLNQAVETITARMEIRNLFNIDRYFDEGSYWERLARLGFHEKLFEQHHYHFLYEIQGLSNQIHFGLVNCFLFRDKISTKIGSPNIFNHRYTFMIESTIHCIYSYWNRVGLVLNTYTSRPKPLQKIYFKNAVYQLKIDYPDLAENELYNWICKVDEDLIKLGRNEFAHNNSLIMQNFLSRDSDKENFEELLNAPEILLYHNKLIVDEIYNLVRLLEFIEQISPQNEK